MEYEHFLATKVTGHDPVGFEDVPDLSDKLFPHQYDVCSWALRLGKAAAFLGTGMGKSLLELEWARIVSVATGKPVLILAPLAVADQIVSVEAPKFEIDAAYYESGTSDLQGIVVTNYERLSSFDTSVFGGVVLDESSILKSFDGKTRTALIEAFQATPYRLAATATPAPNDYMELGNHAEFLGVMTRNEMLAMFFKHDGGETQKWTLKGHARKDFWRWVCSWAVSMRKPSDIGHSDEGFILPELVPHEFLVNVRDSEFIDRQAVTLQERLRARRESIRQRTRRCARIVEQEPDEAWVIWCNLNTEAEALAEAIPGAVNLTGSDKPEVKRKKLMQFASGEIKVLITKPSIAGFGLNWQHCARTIFTGLNDSWEQFYQAVRRFWRFGQKRPVHYYVVAAKTEGAVIENIKRKDVDAEHMAQEMSKHMLALTRKNLMKTAQMKTTYDRKLVKSPDKRWMMHLADCVDLARELPKNCVGFSVFSPPFEALYTYSNSVRDMGNSSSSSEFWTHFEFLITEQFRVMKPGRLVSIHCMNLPTSKARQGFIGIRDFRGEIIRAYERAGFIYHSEVCIWKNPVTAMQRTKALGLLHKTIRKDSSMSRQGIPDYLVTMRKPGVNPDPIPHTAEEFPVGIWQKYASPVWMDINPSDTLQYRSARDHDDERHICPLQLNVIRRAIELWSKPDDIVWSPFAGIGSEGYVALEMGRRFIGSELKSSYFEQAVKNLEAVQSKQNQLFPVGSVEGVEPAERKN